MAYIAFIAILFGAAGIVGGIETENVVGTAAAAVVHVGGIMALAITDRKESDPADDIGSTDPHGSSTVDKHPERRDDPC